MIPVGGGVKAGNDRSFVPPGRRRTTTALMALKDIVIMIFNVGLHC